MKNDRFISSVCFVRKYGNPDEAGNQVEVCKEGLENQIKFNNEYGLPATYLLQYDALIDKNYTEIFMNEYKNHDSEIGAWFEVVKPLAEDSGIKWRGRDNRIWDHFVNPGFLMAYTLEEKKKLIDVFMHKFKEIYGFYPKTVGSWLLDTESMAYISENYSPDAFIICREQWGMDGYTLWGGPYYGAYYPSKNNMQTPAQKIENQINTPVFRMYVNDPIYCYYEYANMKYNDIDYGLFTQEPGWMCGQNPQWIKWHYANIFNDNNIGIKYTQLGQENSFGWEVIKCGHEYQIKYAIENKDKYGYEFVKFSEMGRRFKKENKMTPPMLRYVLDDWADKGNKSVWYNSSRYRINIFSDKEQVWIRDIHIFDDNYRDQYLDNPCTTPAAIYDNLPVMDGIRFSSETERAGIYFGNGEIADVENKDDTVLVKLIVDNKEIKIVLNEKNIEIISDNDFMICYKVASNCKYISEYSKNSIVLKKDKYKYSLNIKEGRYDGSMIHSESGKIIFEFDS